MERHRCKLCYRKFSNGRALGGHMRSHMMKLYASKKSSSSNHHVEKQHQPSDHHHDSDDYVSVHSYSTTSDEDEDEDEVVVLDHQDRDSETESFRRNCIRRSKRVRRSRVSDFNNINNRFNNDQYNEVMSSISDTTPEEHVAHCLIMLSRDKWDHVIADEDDHDDDDHNSDQDSGLVKLTKTKSRTSINTTTSTNTSSNKVRGRYKCETCNKLFKSYQALGGHRASHKKIKLTSSGDGSGTMAGSEVPVAAERVHECPFCDRVFSSGQALGGHKRSHFIGGGVISRNHVTNNVGTSTTTENVVVSRNVGESLNIDLNLPAPVDDDEISQIVNPVK